MTDRPILFSEPMICALLEGRKTQTRRVLTNGAAHDAVAVFGPDFLELPGNRDLLPIRAITGDRLWVRETHAIDGPRVRYFATDDVHALRRKRPSIHMPRWASRLTLVVGSVRVQKVQDISEHDARAEGVDSLEIGTARNPMRLGYRAAFRELWDHLNDLRGFGWDANPWVCALTFTVHHCNIDWMGADV